MNIRTMAKYLRSNNIRKIYYIHVDHFEPMSMDGSACVSSDVINQFIFQSKKYPHSRNMTLFLRPNFGVGFNGDKSHDSFSHVEGDDLGFYKTPELHKVGSYIERILSKTELDLELHIHHENFTTTDEGKYAKDVKKYLINNSTMRMDEKRFDLYVKLCLEFLRKHSGKSFSQWFFVHGKWGLNASDRGVCRIDAELDILRRNGCKGDFTFPAGRKKCDPFIKKPFSCKTPHIWRNYDYTTSEAKPVSVNTDLLVKNRFFIWNSDLTHPLSSLDFYSPAVNEQLSETNRFIENLLFKSPKIGDAIFIKTYAHSMSEEYINRDEIIFPFSHPNVISAFERLMLLSDKAGVDFKCITASQAYNIIKKFDNRKVSE